MLKYITMELKSILKLENTVYDYIILLMAVEKQYILTIIIERNFIKYDLNKLLW